MTTTKHVKMLRDGQEYWLFWHWDKLWAPDTHPTDEQLPKLSGRYLYASGPFGTAAEAKKAIKDDWTMMPER
jgi:hypothetical protein